MRCPNQWWASSSVLNRSTSSRRIGRTTKPSRTLLGTQDFYQPPSQKASTQASHQVRPLQPQLCRDPASLRPSSRATCAIGRDPSTTIFTASCRYSGENFLRRCDMCLSFPLTVYPYWAYCPEVWGTSADEGGLGTERADIGGLTNGFGRGQGPAAADVQQGESDLVHLLIDLDVEGLNLLGEGNAALPGADGPDERRLPGCPARLALIWATVLAGVEAGELTGPRSGRVRGRCQRSRLMIRVRCATRFSWWSTRSRTVRAGCVEAGDGQIGFLQGCPGDGEGVDGVRLGRSPWTLCECQPSSWSGPERSVVRRSPGSAQGAKDRCRQSVTAHSRWSPSWAAQATPAR
jgi:hypothetical protein